MDFVHHQLALSKKVRILTVVDVFSKFSPVVDPRLSYRAEDVDMTLERIFGQVGYPKTIWVDQGSAFVPRDLAISGLMRRASHSTLPGQGHLQTMDTWMPSIASSGAASPPRSSVGAGST